MATFDLDHEKALRLSNGNTVSGVIRERDGNPELVGRWRNFATNEIEEMAGFQKRMHT